MMPESLFEPLLTNESNTVAFGTFGTSDIIFNDLGIPPEFALIFDDAIPNSKSFDPTSNIEYNLPLNQNQFLSESVDSKEQLNYFGYPKYGYNLFPEVNRNPDHQYNFTQSLRNQNSDLPSTNQSFPFTSPDLESAFSDSVTTTPNLQSQNFQSNKSFELFMERFTSTTKKSNANELKKTSGPVASKKHKRKHVMARSRTGCWICRIKHLKCDELRPNCHNCTRFGIQCDFSEARPAYVLDMNLRKEKLDSITTKKRRRTSD